MSRLKPAFGAIAPAAGRQQAASKQQEAFNQDVGLVLEKAHLTSRECVDASLQGGDLEAGLVTCWHPKYPILAVATSTAVVEYDAVSGCRRNFVESTGSPIKLRYTPNGEHLILLTKERNITSWSTSSWRRSALLTAEARYAERPLVSGLLAISAGNQPVVYYSPMGKNTLRTIHMVPPTAPSTTKGSGSATTSSGKLEKELLPGYKLKTENKKPIVGLAAHPYDPSILFLLLVDGTLLVCGVGSGILTILCGVAVQFDASKERVQLHAVPHPQQPGAALVLVEAERSGLTVLNVPSRNEVRVLCELSVGSGAVLAGSGLLHRSCLLVAAVRHAGGNVGIRTWRLRTDSRAAISITSVTTSPSTVWDALQSDSAADASSLTDVSGEAVVAGMVPHGPSGLLAFWTGRQNDSTGAAAHFRLPLLAMVDGDDPLESLGAAKVVVQMTTAPSFWTARAGHDGVVPKLQFPRYAYTLNSGRVSSYDLTHGLLSDFMVPPMLNSFAQERTLVRTVQSSKQALWLPFMQIVSSGTSSTPASSPSSPFGPGHIQFTAVPEAEASISVGSNWWMSGRDACFAGGRDELTVILSNSGTLLAVFDTPKLTQQQQQQGINAPRALYIAELKENSAIRLFPGPCAHIPAAPEPRPEEPDAQLEAGEETDEEAEEVLREWEENEARRVELPRKMLILTADNKLILSDVTQSALSSSSGGGSIGISASSGSGGGLSKAKHVLKLRLSEAVVQISWQTLINPADDFHIGCEGANTALPCVAAVVTTERILIIDDRLQIVAAANFAGDMGIPVSSLWVGPALLVTTSANQVMHVRFDGQIDHVASLLSGPPMVLLAALADRLVVAARGAGPGILAGKTEVATRAFAVLPAMLVGWAGAVAKGWLPGGTERARKEMKILLASYDASQLPVAVLDVMASSGFADVAAAAAARSELPAVTPARKAALAAAAGDWTAVLQLVANELENSEWHPYPPPKWSTLYKKVVALARTCEAHGRFTQARQLFEAAGAWNELLALCVFQGDFNALQGYARQAGKDVEGLADQLCAVNENTFMRLSSQSAFGGRPNVEDWTVRIGQSKNSTSREADGGGTGGGIASIASLDGDFASKLGITETEEDGDMADSNNLMDFMDVEWEVAPGGRLPSMEASLRVTTAAAASGVLPSEVQGEDGEEEGQPIAALDMHSLDAYLGVSGASVLKDATGGGGAGGGGGGVAAAAMLLDRADTTSSTELGAAAAQLAGGGNTPRLGAAGDSISLPDSEADAVVSAAAAAARGETVAQSAARAAFQREEDEDDFFSSDEDESTHAGGGGRDGDAKSQGSFAASTSNRLLINIRSPNETPRPTTDGASLRTAALSLKLGGSGPTGTSGQPQPSSSSGAGAAAVPSTDKSSYSDDDRSSISSMEMLNIGSRTMTTLSIPTPPPAAPLGPASPALIDDPFAAFADFNTTTPSGGGGSGEVPASGEASGSEVKQQHIVSKDPFAGLPGLPPTLAQSASTSAAAATAGGNDGAGGRAGPFGSSSSITAGASVPLAAAAFSEEILTSPSGAPMRAQPAAPVAQSDLLSGWDQFEALFGGSTSTGGTAASQDMTVLPGTAEEESGEEVPAGTSAEASASQPTMTGPSATTTATGVALPVQPPGNVKKPYAAGITAFRKGKWSQAAEQLGKALNGASGHKDPTTADAFRQQCAYLYAAATLIVRSAAAPPAAASRLSRFATALPLGEEQRAVTAAFAVEANMAAGNYAWAGDQLTWLVVVASEGLIGGPGLDPGTLSERLAACDRAGNTDAAVPAEEDVESFAAIVGSCQEKGDIDELLANLMQG